VKDALIILAKAPDPKNVLTRLKGHLTEEERLKLYTRLLEGTVEKLRDIESVETFICYWPPDAEGWFSRFGLPVFAQPEGDLGLRMYSPLERVLKEGHEKAALVGVDIPGLSALIISNAFRALDNADIVLGPAADGGYYLVGLKSPVPGMFEAIEWSTERTLSQTLQKIDKLGLSYALVDTLNDIDTVKDLGASAFKPLESGKGER